MSELSRRSFLNKTALMGAALALGRWLPSPRPRGRITPTATVFPANRVVHAHCNAATYWDYTTGWYGNYVDQTIVDVMTDQGVMALTNTATPADAWHAVIPTYAAGQVLAIKINLNNATSDDSDQIIDALPQPVNSVIRGLKSIGVDERDIWVYDVTDGMHLSAMPGRLVGKVLAPYPDVQFHSNTADYSTVLGYSSTEKVHFNVPPDGPSIDDLPICNALVDATYLINMPVMKKHSGAGVTLGFKNHFGSIQHNNLLHWATLPIDPKYVPSYSSLVDIFSNPHFVGKTVLTIGDGLFGARFNQYGEVPSPWPTFGNMSPNSLFFSMDPVAIDCVMLDVLDTEGGVMPGSDDYLRIAGEHGLGSYERRNAMQQYQAIDYRRIEVGLTPSVFLPFLARDGNGW